MTEKKDTLAQGEAQPQYLAERLSIAVRAAADASKLVGELARLADLCGDDERVAIQAIVPRLKALTRLGMMAGHPDVTLEQLEAWRAAPSR